MIRRVIVAAALLFIIALLPSRFQSGRVTAQPSQKDWLPSALEEIRRAEYACSTESGGSCSAPNRAHDLRTRFTSEGLHLTSRTHGAAAWSLRMQVTGIGREGLLEATRPIWPAAKANRVEYARGRITEWYVNEERGLEQGFTLTAPPAGGESSGPLVINIEVSGTLTPRAMPDGDAVMFSTASGEPTLLYSGLVVTDGAGKRLDADLVPVAGGIQLRFSDAGAIYPIVVDPLLTSPTFSPESNQSNAQLGISVAAAGDVNNDGFSDIAIGAKYFDSGQTDEGVVFIYHGGATFSSGGTLQGDFVAGLFGAVVSTAGDVNGDNYDDLIVGAPNYHGGGDQQGRAYVYLGSAFGLTVPPAWRADGDSDFGHLGSSVAWAGDVNADGYDDVLVGQPYYSDGVTFYGRAFIWFGGASGLGSNGTPGNAGWVVTGQEGGALGVAVAAAGDVDADGDGDVIIGESLYDGGQTDEGRALLYLGSTSGPGMTAIWTAESDDAGAQFGASVATAGDVDGDGYADVLVGAPLASNVQSQEGRAFLYRGTSSGLTLSSAWRAESNLAGSRFGTSVATAGDVNGDAFADVIIGASLYANGQTGEGKAFAWFGGNGGLGEDGLPTNADWLPVETDQVQAQYGTSVGTAGDVNGDGYSDVIVGAPMWESTGGQANEGRAYVYLGQPGKLSAAATSTSQGLDANAHYGASVASAGDVNADGYGDLIVGAPDFDGGHSDEGAVFAFNGGPNGPTFPGQWTVQINQAYAHLGKSVAYAGDINGDGFSDVIVGAPGYDDDQTNEGRVLVYIGGNSGLSTGHVWSATGDANNTEFGAAVSTAGDINGDGFADILVGAPMASNSHAGEGRVFVWNGSVAGLGAQGSPANADWTFDTDCVNAHLGFTVATAGDVNRDGYSDVIVGAPDQYNDCFNQEHPVGFVFVFHGGSGGLSTIANWTAKSHKDNSDFGTAVAGAGDVNGDGYSDVIIGAPLFQNSQSQIDEGHVFVWHGSSGGVNNGVLGRTGKTGTSGPDENFNWRAQADRTNAKMGMAVATAGDVNSDGYSDVLVGAPFYDNGVIDGGGAFVWNGSVNGVNNDVDGTAGGTPNYAWSAEGGQDNAEFGCSVAPAADTNGDGYTDVIIGALKYDNPTVDEGRAFVFLGNEGDGLERLARQGRFGDTSTIDLLGKTYNTGDKFRVVGRGRTAAGRDKIRLQWEVDPLGTAFNGTGLSTSTVRDTGVPVSGIGSTVGFTETHSGLGVGTMYRWRQRVLGNSPLFPRSPWFTLPYNSVNESDLRAATGAPPAGDNCGPCPISYCSSGGYLCEFNDTCGPSGCCNYDCTEFTGCLPDICEEWMCNCN